MGLFKSVKKAVKSVTKAVTSVAKVAAPVIGAYVGGPAGAAIGGAISGAASGGGLKGAVLGAGLSYAGTNLLTGASSASDIFGAAGKVLDGVGKVANVFQVVKAMNSATGEVRYIGVNDTIPSGFTVDSSQAPLTVSSPNYENNLGAAKPTIDPLALQAAMQQNTQSSGNNNNQLLILAGIGLLGYVALKGKK